MFKTFTGKPLPQQHERCDAPWRGRRSSEAMGTSTAALQHLFVYHDECQRKNRRGEQAYQAAFGHSVIPPGAGGGQQRRQLAGG
jgi:hypothetical protein